MLLPLTLKQFNSMQRLQLLAPEMKAIQAKYKDDKQRQQQEMMKFYKENKVNPLGSCLPLVLAAAGLHLAVLHAAPEPADRHLPGIAAAAYQHGHGVAARTTTPCGPHDGASFLFIPDLTDKATGAVLVVLIVLYVGTQLGSSLLMSSADDGHEPAADHAGHAARLRRRSSSASRPA